MLWKQTVQFCIHKGFPIIPHNHNPIPHIDTYFFILILSSHLCLSIPRVLFSQVYILILKALLLSSILARCPAHFILLHLITLTIFCWTHNHYIGGKIIYLFFLACGHEVFSRLDFNICCVMHVMIMSLIFYLLFLSLPICCSWDLSILFNLIFRAY